jgi:flagellar motility protein MotE (MotC chaperone)
MNILRNGIRGKSPFNGGKNRRGGVLVTGLTILLLLAILFLLLIATAFVFDYLGIIPMREHLPKWALDVPMVKEYVLEADLLSANDVEKVKAYRHQLEVKYEELRKRIKRREFQMERRLDEMNDKEKKLRSQMEEFNKEYEVRLQILASKEIELNERESILNTSEVAKKRKNDEYKNKIAAIAKVYEKMEPRVAADALSRLDIEEARTIIMLLPANKSAKILNFVDADVIQKLTPPK